MEILEKEHARQNSLYFLKNTNSIIKFETSAKKRNIVVNCALFQYRLKISNELFPNSQLFDKFNYLKYLTNYFLMNYFNRNFLSI